MSDIAALIAAVSAAVSALTAVGTLWVSVRRGSDRENREAARIAVEVAKPPENVTPIERERGEA